MIAANWPYVHHECPICAYFQRFDPPIDEDDGYQTLGFCRHPQIAMELVALKRSTGRPDHCPCFIRGPL